MSWHVWQRGGQDYDETISPVVQFESLRTTIAIAVQNDMMLHHMMSHQHF